jgi:ParB family chromosome partitioning protein
MNETMMTEQITTRSPFKDLFSINLVTLKAIEADMKEYGYDESAPIVLWNDGNVVIDGHTRLQAARNIGLKEVNVCLGDFDEQTALEYAIHNQRDRRNLTDAEIFKCVEVVDKRQKTGRKQTEKNVVKVDNIPSHEQTAVIVGVKPSKVKKIRTILDSNNEQIKQEVLKGKKSIHAASEEIRKAKLKDKPIAAQINIAGSKFEKNLKKAIDTAIKEGLTILQLKQIVKRLLQEGP